MTKEQKKLIQKEYEAIKYLNIEKLHELAKKHGLTFDELLDIIDL
jgi:hypothetical protein